MRKIAALLGLTLGLLTVSAVPTEAETGSFQVLVNGVLHTIGYQAFLDQQVSDLLDPTRFRLPEGVFVSLEVFDPSPTQIIEKVSVELPPLPRLPQGAELDVPQSFLDPGDTGVSFFLGSAYPAAGDIGTIEFVIKLITGDKIRIAPFPITLRRLPDLMNVQFLDNTTKPVITWASLPGVQRYRVKVKDPETGLAVFVTNSFLAAPGDVQMLDLKAPPTGGFPIGWAGMELGKRYVIRIDGRLDGPVPMPPPTVVTLPIPKHARVPAPAPGQGRITRSRRVVEYTPLVP